MSDYIRTPNTIFEVVGESGLIYVVKAKGNPYHTYSKSKCQTDVLARADNLEELCDEFVLTWACQKRLHNTLEGAKFWYSQLRKEIRHLGIIYGAIWTDKGLIYVAKMNDKGELELL